MNECRYFSLSFSVYCLRTTVSEQASDYERRERVCPKGVECREVRGSSREELTE